MEYLEKSIQLLSFYGRHCASPVTNTKKTLFHTAPESVKKCK